MSCRRHGPAQLLRDFFNTVDHLMAILELKENTLVFNMANQNLASLLGVSSETLVCRALEDFTELDDCLDRWLRNHKTDPDSPLSYTFECKLRSRAPEIWLECRISPMSERKDGLLFYGFVAVDITARKKDREELDYLKMQLHNIMDLGTEELNSVLKSLKIILNKIPVMICCYDAAGKVLFVNRTFEETLGWSLAEVRNSDVMKACYPDPGRRRGVMKFMMSGKAECRDFTMRRRNNTVIETSWASAPLTSGIRLGIGLDITQRKQSEDAIRLLSKKTLDMLESDRQAVAKDLHDSIGASLAAIKFTLEGRVMGMNDMPPKGEMSLETIISHLTDTIKETKRISNGLRPLTLDDLGLMPTLAAYVRHMRESYPNVEIVHDIDIQESDLSSDLKIVLYRVAQEALNNTHKHSRASKAYLRLKQTDSHVELSVEDNGCGFDVENTLGRSGLLSGYGLRSMRERVEISDGTFRIRSAANAGTRISAVFRLR